MIEGAAGVGSVTTSPQGLMDRLVDLLGAGLGDDLMGLSVHGSWVAGDFCPGRSDLDFLAVLAHDPDDESMALLTGSTGSWTQGRPIGWDTSRSTTSPRPPWRT